MFARDLNKILCLRAFRVAIKKKPIQVMYWLFESKALERLNKLTLQQT